MSVITCVVYMKEIQSPLEYGKSYRLWVQTRNLMGVRGINMELIHYFKRKKLEAHSIMAKTILECPENMKREREGKAGVEFGYR